jgi:hypothetical protein
MNLEGQVLSTLLVKLSATRCAVFLNQSSSSTPAYDMLADNQYLLLANLAGAPSGGLQELRSALDAARKPFLEIVNRTQGIVVGRKIDKSNVEKPLATDANLISAIHIPLLVSHPDKGSKAPALFSDPLESSVGRQRRKDHLDLIGAVDLSEIRTIVDSVCELGAIALISEFTPMVEMVKYLSLRTRLKKYYNLSTGGSISRKDLQKLKTIGIVYRADQFVGVLLHSRSNFADRNQIELVGALVRRLATFFIYPCEPLHVVNGKSFRGTNLASAFSREGLEKINSEAHGPVTLDSLFQCLDEREGYLDMLNYLKTTRSISQLTI